MSKQKGLLSAGGLFMGLIILLGMIGIVSGLWSKNLIVNGVVQTGDLNADWDCAYTNDDGLSGAAGVVQGGHPCGTDVLEPAGDTGLDPDNFDWPDFNDWDHPLKNVGSCEVDIGDDDPAGFGDQVATITIVNAYPSYECTTTLFVSNTGSIPFNVIGSQLNLAEDLPIEALPGSCGFDLDDPQVDPGEELSIDCTIHVKQEAEQNVCVPAGAFGSPEWGANCTPPVGATELVTYEFDIMVCVAQWNEDPSTGGQNQGLPFDEEDFNACKDSPQHEGPGGAGDGDGIVGDADACPNEAEDGVDDPNQDPAVLPNPDDGCPDLL